MSSRNNLMKNINEDDSDNEEPPRPTKRQKTNSPQNNPIQDETLRRELKMLLLKNPQIDIKSTCEVDQQIDSMSIDQVRKIIENAKIEIGLLSPVNTAEEFLGTVGLILQKLTGNLTIHDRLVNDCTLISSIQQWIPLSVEKLSVPLQIFHRLVGHMTDIHFGTDVKKPPKLEIPIQPSYIPPPYVPPPQQKIIVASKSNENIKEDDDSSIEAIPFEASDNSDVNKNK